MFDPFVLPFTLGALYLLARVGYVYYRCIADLPKQERLLMKQHILSNRMGASLSEIGWECLLHRKIFKVNPRLGFMHMSLALGWFLLIVVGNLESRFIEPTHINPPYVPIFQRFFHPQTADYFFAGGFHFLMDAFLLLVLSGVALALYKRVWAAFFGMKRTTRLTWGDKTALYTLWLIFPLRWLAESVTAGHYGTSSFFTGSSGALLASFLPVEQLIYPAWWVYSLALGVFFVAMPSSRYLHILTEPLLIIMRSAGIERASEVTGRVAAEVNACSRCGICIDVCQLSSSLAMHHIQPAYLIKTVREKRADSLLSENCLMCGRCNEVCPVGIDSVHIRQITRKQIPLRSMAFTPISQPSVKTAKVAYFGGCMSQLTPGISRAMVQLFQHSKTDYRFLDRDTSICCGRPLALVGKEEQASQLRDKNRDLIIASEAELLVTSCPICYHEFKNRYALPCQVMHHSEFIALLLRSGQLKIESSNLRLAYHEPCELGRKSGVRSEPLEVLQQTAYLLENACHGTNALCCGGSLANTRLDYSQQQQIAADAALRLCANNPDKLITACPLCKKTFAQVSPVPVLDLAEIVAQHLPIAHVLNKDEIRAKEHVVMSLI